MIPNGILYHFTKFWDNYNSLSIVIRLGEFNMIWSLNYPYKATVSWLLDLRRGVILMKAAKVRCPITVPSIWGWIVSLVFFNDENATKFAFGCHPWDIWKLQVQGTKSKIAFFFTFSQYIMHIFFYVNVLFRDTSKSTYNNDKYKQFNKNNKNLQQKDIW